MQQITVDPSQVSAIEVDPSEVSAVASPGRGGTPGGAKPGKSPTWFDRIQQGATGGLMNPGQDRGDDPISRTVRGIGSSLGRTTKAWSDAISFRPTDTTAAEMIPLIGPAAVDAARMMGTPGQRLEGIGAAGALLAPAISHGGVPAINAGDIKTAISDKVFAGEPHEMAFQAIKPRASKLDFANTLKTAMPDIKAAETTPITGVADTLDAVKAAKAANRAAYDQFRGPAKQRGTVVDMTPVADAVEKSIPHDLQFEADRGVSSAVSAVKAIKQQADAYRTKVPLEDAEKHLMAANAKLDEFYARYPRQQWKALETNPETAATYAKAEAARRAIYSTLDSENGGAGAKELQSRYGKLLEVEQELQRRKNVTSRQQPQSLAQQIGKAQAVGKLALAGGKAITGNGIGAVGSALEAIGTRSASDWMKEQQTSDALLARAFRNYKSPHSPFPTPEPVQIRGLLEAGPRRMPAGVESPPEYRTGYPAGEWERQGFVPKQLPAATSGIGVSGTIVPDIIGRSSRGQGTPYRLLSAPQEGIGGRGNRVQGVVQPNSEVSGPGAKTIGPPAHIVTEVNKLKAKPRGPIPPPQ